MKLQLGESESPSFCSFFIVKEENADRLFSRWGFGSVGFLRLTCASFFSSFKNRIMTCAFFQGVSETLHVLSTVSSCCESE
jgi:hypothetical protein